LHLLLELHLQYY